MSSGDVVRGWGFGAGGWRVMRGVGSLVIASLALSCAHVVKSTYLRPDYDQVDRTQTKRIAIAIAPVPDHNQKVGDLWALMAKRTLRLKRDYIVKSAVAQDVPGPSYDWKSQCAEGIEGVLWISPAMAPTKNGFQTSLVAHLFRCRDGEEIWNATAQGHWPSHDEGLKEVTARYVADVGPEVEPYVVPTHRILRGLVDAVPQVTLNDKDKEEKIEVEAEE